MARATLLNYPSLTARMLYAWCDLYSKQLQSGQDYHLLQPTYAIWLVNNTVFAQDDSYRRYFAMRDERQQPLLAYGGIWVIGLKKFQAAVIATQQQRWLPFFNQAEQFTGFSQLPDWMQDTTMRQAMSILNQFSEKERAYHQYQARQNYLREQSSIQKDIAELRQPAEAERTAKEAALTENAALLAQLAELKAQLARKV